MIKVEKFMYQKENSMIKGILYILLACLLSCFDLYSQNSEEKAYGAYKQLEDLTYDAIASFCQYPNIHKNTFVVFETLEKISAPVRDICSMSVPDGAMDLYTKYENLNFQIDCFKELLKVICGYNSTGLQEDQMFFVVDCLKGMGWTEKVLGVDCDNAYFIEYQYQEFKMLFIKNTLPAKLYDYTSGASNLIEVDFTYDHLGLGGTYNVGAGKYRMIQYKDDFKSDYYKVIKATSRLVN